MINLNLDDSFLEYVAEHPEYKIVVYGAGHEAGRNYPYIGHIDYFCDKRAEEIHELKGIPCILPEDLQNIGGKLIVLICICQEKIMGEVCAALGELRIDAEVFWFFHNPSFPVFVPSVKSHSQRRKERLKICIVYKEDGWIFGKFARKLQEELGMLGQDVWISEEEDATADVNHFISYARLAKFYGNAVTVRTTMVTHIDTLMKKELIFFQARHGAVGICMSADTQQKLISWGMPADKICYINPAQDGEIQLRKMILGITNRCHFSEDLRKRDDFIVKVCEQLNPEFFKLRIMGGGWNDIVRRLRELKFEVDYYAEFDREIYMQLMPSLDYWLYYGFDEGAMGYLDALAAGVKTIATPQGYHLDTKCGLTYPCSTVDDFAMVLKQIQNEKQQIVDSVKDWTWENYAKKHLEIWQYLTSSRPLKELYTHQGEYMDGIFSLLVQNNCVL